MTFGYRSADSGAVGDVWFALRLATGRCDRLPADEQHWRRVRLAASRERLAVLAWIRSGSVVRNVAPPSEVAAWRGAYAHALARAAAQADLLGTHVAAIGDRGIPVVVLKGLPLSARLYGDAAARTCSDVDLFVPPSKRVEAHQTLKALGWVRTEGDVTGEETYVWRGSGGTRVVHLELHSSLLHPRFDYLALPAPRGAPVQVFEATLPSHDDDLLPAYLAAHLACHREPPLLWFVDLLTLWRSLETSQRTRAREAASAVGLRRYLEWGVRRAADMERAVDDMSRLRSFGFGGFGRREPHPMWRHVALAPTTRSRYFAIRAWVSPAWVERSIAGWAKRIVAHAPEALGLRTARATAGPSGTRSVGLTSRTAAGELRQVLRAAPGLWFRVTGQSMSPAIRDGEEVLLTPVTRTPENGDVVLAQTPHGVVLHRVIRSTSEAVQTKGDSSATCDPAVEPHDIIALAAVVRSAGGRVALRAELRYGTAAAARYLWRRMRAYQARRAWNGGGGALRRATPS